MGFPAALFALLTFFVAGALRAAPSSPVDGAYPYSTTVESGYAVPLAPREGFIGAFWFAPPGTTQFSASQTMTTSGAAAAALVAPSRKGTYKLFAANKDGKIIGQSRATLTVGPFTIRRAREFTDSVGLNTHMAYETFPDYNWDKVIPLLLDLGVYRLRDTMYLYERNDVRVKHFNFLKAKGFQFICELRPNVKRVGTYDKWTQADVDAEIGAKILAIRANTPGLCFALAAPNEPDAYFAKLKGSDLEYKAWPNALKMYMQGIQRLGGRYLTGVPVIGPGLAHPERYARIVGDMSGYADFGDFHPYPGGRPFESRIPDIIQDVRPMYPAPTKLFATEAGYVNNLAQCCDHPSVTMRAMRIYYPRMSFEAFRVGLVNTALFQLIDSSDPVSGAKTTEAFQGLVDFSFSPKPTYYVVRNMMSLLKDTERPFDIAPFEISVEGSKDVRTVALQKSDGKTYLAIWRTVSVCDQSAVPPKDVFPPAEKVRVRIGGAGSRVYVYRLSTMPNGGKASKRMDALKGSEIDISLEGELIILEVIAKA